MIERIHVQIPFGWKSHLKLSNLLHSGSTVYWYGLMELKANRCGTTGELLRFLKRDFHDIWLQAGFEKILIYCDSNGGNYSLPGTIACSSPAPTPFLSLSWGFAIQGWPGEWWCGRWCLVDESQIRNKGWSWSQSWGQSWYRLRSWSWAGPSGIKNFNPGIFRDGIS